MSLLQIDKKAVTEADARKILLDSYGLKDPFGVPTFYINPEKYAQDDLHYLKTLEEGELYVDPVRKNIENQIKEEMGALFKEFSIRNLERKYSDLLEEGLDSLSYALSYHIFRINMESAVCITHDSPYHDFKEAYSIVIMPSWNTSLEDIQNFHLGDEWEDIGALPGNNAQYLLICLWHEIGHGMKVGEPQTESIASIISRRHFENQTFMSALSDMRAINAIKDYDYTMTLGNRKKFVNNVYGWPMVEVNDHIMGVSQSKLDAMSEDDIKSIRLQAFDFKSETVRAVAKKLESKDPNAFSKSSFAALDTAAQALRETDMPADERQILTRFQLACRRIHHGASAYEDGNDLVEQELLDSQHQAPMTFTPGEYITEEYFSAWVSLPYAWRLWRAQWCIHRNGK